MDRLLSDIAPPVLDPIFATHASASSDWLKLSVSGQCWFEAGASRKCGKEWARKCESTQSWPSGLLGRSTPSNLWKDIRSELWRKTTSFWGAQFTMNGSCRLPFCGPTEHAEEVDETAVFDVSREPVILNIYDMFWTNDYTANVGLGVRQGLLFPKRNLIWKQQCCILPPVS